MADDVIEKPNSTETFIDKLASDDNAGAGEAFKDALKDKVGTALDAQRVDVAGNLFNTTAISDPKPNVADPAPTTTQMIDPDGNDITDKVAPEVAPAEAPAENVEGQ